MSGKEALFTQDIEKGRFPPAVLSPWKKIMTRTCRSLMWGILLIGLTSCGHRQAPEMVPTPRPPISRPKVKPVPPVSEPAPIPEPAQPQFHKIGLLLPLTGEHAHLGKRLLDASEMALFEAGNSSVTLLPQDTAQGAHQAALKALDEGAELLVGPIFAAEVEAVKPLLSARNVSLVCFSTDQNVAGNGTFILGFLPVQQIERVLSFAKEKGLSKIAALTPEGQYGRHIDQILKRLESQGMV